MTRLTLIGTTNREVPDGEPREVFMVQYQEARDQIVTLLERLGDPIMTGILHSGGNVNRQVMVTAREHAQRTIDDAIELRRILDASIDSIDRALDT